MVCASALYCRAHDPVEHEDVSSRALKCEAKYHVQNASGSAFLAGWPKTLKP